MSARPRVSRSGPVKPVSVPQETNPQSSLLQLPQFGLSTTKMATSQPLRFLFQVDSIEPSNGSDVAPSFQDWIPPSHTDRYVLSPIPNPSSDWYLWTPSSVQIRSPSSPGSPPPETVEENTTTLFWDFRTSRYYGVSTDCRKQDVATFEDEGHPAGWRKLGFQYITQNGRELTLVHFFGQEEGLGAPASATWMPQFLPFTSALPPGREHPPSRDKPHPSQGNTQLVGKISLLVALAAMSGDFERLPDIMREAFKPPHWIPHELGSGRHFQRGVVVKVRRMQNAPRLTLWEDGSRGPLISGRDDPPYRET